MSTPILMLPGLGNSGPDHWQSLWELSGRPVRRVVQRDWDRPELGEWLAALERHVTACATPPVLVAHSLACSLVAHWVRNGGHRIKAALLVAPSDVDSPMHTPPEVRGFSPIPLAPFPFPSIVVASTDDPYASLDRAALFARAWGSRLVTVANAGHINASSGLQDWPQGQALLEELLRAV